MNPKQYNEKKKRVVGADAVPKPNLFSHEQKLKQSDLRIIEMEAILQRQQQEIESLKRQLHSTNITLEGIRSQLSRRTNDGR